MFVSDLGLMVQFLTPSKNGHQDAVTESEQLEELCNLAFLVSPQKWITLHVDPISSISEVYKQGCC